MSCTNPLMAIDLGIKENGKHRIKMIPRRVDYSFAQMKERYGSMLVLLPCGSCDACVLTRRKTWSIRCYCESLYHEDNCFVTLTYDDQYYPGEPVKKDLQRFIKSLRNSGVECRYYSCCERGGLTGRWHFHIILFGFRPDDLRYWSKSKSGNYQYTSKFLSDIWKKGFVTVSDFSPEVAGYVAGYVDKKYKDRESFTLMSTRPGIGAAYFYDHYQGFYNTDSIVTNFGSHVAAIPRYFDKLAESIGYDISRLKENRKVRSSASIAEAMRDMGVTNYEQLVVAQAQIFKDRLSHKRRLL